VGGTVGDTVGEVDGDTVGVVVGVHVCPGSVGVMVTGGSGGEGGGGGGSGGGGGDGGGGGGDGGGAATQPQHRAPRVSCAVGTYSSQRGCLSAGQAHLATRLRAQVSTPPVGKPRLGFRFPALSPTLQPLQDPILLLPWVWFRDGCFPNPSPFAEANTGAVLKGWSGLVRVQGFLVDTSSKVSG
jgi:hypothetical protein